MAKILCQREKPAKNRSHGRDHVGSYFSAQTVKATFIMYLFLFHASGWGFVWAPG